MKELPLIALCFAAGLVGAMVGSDLSAPRCVPPDYLASRTTDLTPRVLATAAPPGTTVQSNKSGNPVIDAVKRVGPAVVNIDTLVMRRRSIFGFDDPFADFFGSDPFTQLVPSKGQGSGLVIDGEKGYIVTNEHVVHDCIVRKGEIKVSTPNKQTFAAEIVGSDPEYDLAVLRVEAGKLPSAKLASSEDLVIGEWAIAIGNPFGFRNTVTVGVVSALERSLETGDGGKLEGLIQTDAAINPGNSGGPLCDIEGNVIGINTAIIRGAEGLGFSIGASSIRPVLDEIIKFGRVRHGWTGMRFWDISQRLADRFGLESTDGALVVEVYTGSPADKAGVKPGDVLLEIGAKKITSAADIQDELRTRRAGDRLAVTLARKGKRVQTNITLSEIPDELRR